MIANNNAIMSAATSCMNDAVSAAIERLVENNPDNKMICQCFLKLNILVIRKIQIEMEMIIIIPDNHGNTVNCPNRILTSGAINLPMDIFHPNPSSA